jgi:hypothetical protein
VKFFFYFACLNCHIEEVCQCHGFCLCVSFAYNNMFLQVAIADNVMAVASLIHTHIFCINKKFGNRNDLHVSKLMQDASYQTDQTANGSQVIVAEGVSACLDLFSNFYLLLQRFAMVALIYTKALPWLRKWFSLTIVAMYDRHVCFCLFYILHDGYKTNAHELYTNDDEGV